MKKVMAFGVFDGVHGGHREFLRQARMLGDYLIVVVAQDHIVQELKGKTPVKNIEERFEHLRDADGVDMVAIGDHDSNTWEVVKKHKPDIIAIGHDQQVLMDELNHDLPKFGLYPELRMLEVYEKNTPEI